MTSRVANRNSSGLNSSLVLDCTLARSGVQASDSHIVAIYVAQVDLEAAQAVVVGRDAHTVEGYRDDAGLDGGWNIAVDVARHWETIWVREVTYMPLKG